MNAQYFYNRMISYDQESKESRRYYYGYSNGIVHIHRKNDESTYYVIYSNRTVRENTIGPDYASRNLMLEDLEGDDFELFNIVQILKAGYLVLKTKTEFEVKQALSKLYKHIASFDEEYFLPEVKIIPRLCGSSFWNNGVTDAFSYYAVNGIELDLQMIKELCKENMDRKYYGLRCIPFIKTMENEKAIRVNFISNMCKGNYADTLKECSEALTDLLCYMKEIGIPCKWVECKMQKPVYC